MCVFNGQAGLDVHNPAVASVVFGNCLCASLFEIARHCNYFIPPILWLFLELQVANLKRSFVPVYHLVPRLMCINSLGLVLVCLIVDMIPRLMNISDFGICFSFCLFKG